MSFKDWLSDPVATATVATSATDSTHKPGTVATVANVAVASPSERNSDGYHRKWIAVWKSERKLQQDDPERRLITPALIDDALATAVNIWNGMIGDFRTVAELRSHLSADDLADRELMTPAGLALYCWTLWADG